MFRQASLLGFLLACAAPAQRLTHAVSVTIIDKVTSKRLPGVALVLRTPQGEHVGVTSKHGHAQWSTGTEPNVVLRGKPFAVVASAPGYVTQTRKCMALPKTDCEGIAWVCYQVSLEPIWAAQSRPASAVAPTVGPEEWLEYEFVGIKEPFGDDDQKGVVFMSTCYVDGYPCGRMKTTHTPTPQIEFPVDIGSSAKAVLTGYGYEFATGTVAKCAQSVEAEIGLYNRDASYNGREFFRMHEAVITWKVVRHFRNDPRVEFVEEVTTDIVTGCYITFGPPDKK